MKHELVQEKILNSLKENLVKTSGIIAKEIGFSRGFTLNILRELQEKRLVNYRVTENKHLWFITKKRLYQLFSTEPYSYFTLYATALLRQPMIRQRGNLLLCLKYNIQVSNIMLQSQKKLIDLSYLF